MKIEKIEVENLTFPEHIGLGKLRIAFKANGVKYYFYPEPQLLAREGRPDPIYSKEHNQREIIKNLVSERPKLREKITIAQI